MEKNFIYKTYYNFLNNESCLDFINNILLIFSELDEKNKKFIIDEDMEVSLSIIILKSCINNAKFLNNFVNSDDAINFCSDFFTKYCIYRNIYILDNKIRQFFLLIFSILSDKKIIKQKKIKIEEINKFKTIIIYNFNTINYIPIEEELFNFSFCEFKLIEYDNKLLIHTHHFSKIFEICKKNFWSNKTFKPKNLNYIIKKINTKIYIDDFEDQLSNITNKDILLGKLYELSSELKKKYEVEKWNSRTKNEIIIIQKEISKINEEYILHVLNTQKIKNPIYFILYIDFRGRKYYDSIIGPTQSRFLRTFYYYGYYNKNEFLNKTSSIELMNNYDIINKICNKFNWECKNFFYDVVFWCIIGIGKNVVNKNKYPIKEIDFINAADLFLSNTNERKKIKKLDLIEIDHYIKILNNLTEKNMMSENIKKYIIIKDATASVNQIFMKQLGPINQESLNFLNLGVENEWYDTYLVYKEKFKKYAIKEKKIDEFYIDKVLLRKLIKKTIMIIPYSAGFNLCWENYISSIKEERYDIKIDTKLKKIYKLFYSFVKKKMQEKYLYKKNSISYIEKVSASFEQRRKFILESETGEADISYYKLKKSSIEKKYTINNVRKRITKLQLKLTSSLDMKSFNSAAGPNIAHFYDADEIREIELKLEKCYITIHDCYLVDILSCTDLIKAKQDHYNKHILNYKIKNIFIIL